MTIPASPEPNGFVSPNSETGLIIFAHGSRVEAANQSVRTVAGELADLGSFRYVEAAFLELGRPDLQGAANALIAKGLNRILVIPYFLTLGTHLERDLPRLVGQIASVHPGLEIRVARPLDGHPSLVQILLDRSRE
ncbi:MAG: CbiX/SirB N-terminal domain-containing protein [Acidobacteriia bacterium]|nr:CbiX/SirB N-terminal domain-containing protein [Terriglobia bacterium]